MVVFPWLCLQSEEIESPGLGVHPKNGNSYTRRVRVRATVATGGRRLGFEKACIIVIHHCMHHYSAVLVDLGFSYSTSTLQNQLTSVTTQFISHFSLTIIKDDTRMLEPSTPLLAVAIEPPSITAWCRCLFPAATSTQIKRE
jgi:hypothetical protein